MPKKANLGFIIYLSSIIENRLWNTTNADVVEAHSLYYNKKIHYERIISSF